MGHSNISDAFPDYLAPLFNLHLSPLFIIELLIVSLLLLIALFIYFKYLSIKKSLEESYTFLEVKPTDRTLKSPLSTNQLFTVLHSLGKESSGWFVKTKRSMSFELVSSKEEGIRFIMRVPSKDVSSVKKNLLAYLTGIEIKEIEDYVPISQKTQVKEIQFRKPFVFPLEDQATLNQFDPIAYITAHMTKLEENELMALQFITTSIHENTHANVLKYTNKLKYMILNNMDISEEINSHNVSSRLLNLVVDLVVFIALTPTSLIAWFVTSDKAPALPTWVFDKSKKKNINEVGLQKQQFYQSIHSKISQPLFQVTIRLFAITNNQEDGRRRLKGILSSFDTFCSPYQSFKVKYCCLTI